jgi:DNA-binding CsgD family transcriptional regulator
MARVAQVIGRSAELEAIDRFIAALADGPAALVFEGEPGIGKTTLLRAAVDVAGQGGARVLACAPGPGETRLSYAALSDLLAGVDDGALARLAAPQRTALDAALLRSDPGGGEVDPRAVATAVLSLLEDLAQGRPLVVVIDDLQWLDQPTSRVLEFCTRRLGGRVGVLASRRSRERAPAAINLRDPDRLEVRNVAPLGVTDLGRVVRERAERQLSHPALARVHEASGGNPFYALELVRALPADDRSPGALPLPESLDGVVAARLGGHAPDVERALLAVASLADPTVDLVERVVGPRALAQLEEAERRGVVEFQGERVRFTHPLLAHGVYARASAGSRRAMHGRLSEVVADAEERALHLARAGVGREAVYALDTAARQVRARGAPDAAAELLVLALDLGGGPELGVRAAEHLSDAGDPLRAQALLKDVLQGLPGGQARAEALLLLGELRYHDDSWAEAQTLLEQARDEPGADDRVRVMIDLRRGFLLFNLGRFEEASTAATSALAGAKRLGDPNLLGQALASTVICDFGRGVGLHQERLDRALELHDPDTRAPGELRPAHIASFLYRWVGRLDESRALLERLARDLGERGEEHDQAWLALWRVSTECAAGDLRRAAQLAEDGEQRLLALGTPHARVLSLATRTMIAAHLGNADETRRVAQEALALYEQSPWELGALWVRARLGFLELSLGDPGAAVAAFAPLIPMAASGAVAEPTAGDMFFHGDAAEALLAVGQTDQAEAITAWLEERGATLDRTWAIAVGGRCRGLILAAAGDVDAAEQALERALAAHDRLPMPIERARSLLVLGRIRRRARKRRAAMAALEEALEIFERVGTPRWAEQAREEIASVGLRPAAHDWLTPSEERVARLAAGGLTNREVAARLSVTPKTVEAHLARAYRKLDISSRAELGARMGQAEPTPPPPPPQTAPASGGSSPAARGG